MPPLRGDKILCYCQPKPRTTAAMIYESLKQAVQLLLRDAISIVGDIDNA